MLRIDMARRTALLIAAIVVALLGTLLVFLYVQSKSNEVTEANQPVRVLVAAQSIAPGTTGSAASSAGAFVLQEVPKSALVPGAISDAAPILEQTAVTTVFPGQQIIQSQWSATGSTSLLPVAPGKLGVSVQLGDPQRVAGFVAPGSRVTIFSTTPQANGQTATRVLLPDIKVIAVGPTTVVSKSTAGTAATTEQIPTAILTLELTQKESEKVIFATGQGQLYLGLLGKDTKVTAPDQGISTNNLYSP
jgi:pilus assembly protein CpaB